MIKLITGVVDYKSTPNQPWQPWPYLPPTPGTLAILKREAEASFRRALKVYMWLKRKKKPAPMPIPHAIFYGERIYGFRLRGTKQEWDVEQGLKSLA